MAQNLTILGLGAGDLEQLPLGVYRKLSKAENLYLRTAQHPVVEELQVEGLIYTSFDDVYEKHESFDKVYEEIVETLLSLAKSMDVTYAVPGHPLVAEKTVQLLLQRGESLGISIHVEGGQSFLDAMLTSVRVDPIEGFQLLDGTSLHRDDIKLQHHVFIGQVYDAFVASEVKLTLMELLPDDYGVVIVNGAGGKAESINTVPLYELDRSFQLSNLTTVYVPPVQDDRILYQQFSYFRNIIAELRGPNGCPWDKKQTHLSLKKYLLEEAYELFEAIDNDDPDHIVEELGDVLLQVLLHAQIGEDEGMFSIEDVIRHVSDKMIRRHPHVFDNVVARTEADVMKNWEEIKANEKGTNQIDEYTSLLAKVPSSYTALMRAFSYQKKAGKVGFDWQDVGPMWRKVEEEISEFQNEVVNNNASSKEKQDAEFGDVLFALVNVARYYSIDPEVALQMTNEKFKRRFQYIEDKVHKQNKSFDDFTLDELDEIWNEAKKQGL
ncbi:nucleoside triphosphate pyrophosphohydrolase [Bacillus sp. HMF5848]|uniref:nucleoside triphosphate pyrophosphohydrolase n=1 Tax=Bacillus sp. HMF5848 TaxID=2495421 RepID=UPI000F79AC49|nr:nucleoside triphosphate pyrophosphohydrolase [Bacillus sp. HMF5848]RSK25492.1 nucleoside triphosphate pyrophosphohydrolase [Bacillus sp. HMF5848]